MGISPDGKLDRLRVAKTADFEGAETHAGTESHTGTETHSGSVTMSGAVTMSGTPSFTGAPTVPVTAYTTAAEITNFGIATLGTTGTTVAWTLAAPAAGVTKTLVAITTGSTGEVGSVTASTGVTFSSTDAGANRKLSFATKDDYCTLVGLSTLKWAVTSKTTTVTLGGT